MQPGRRGLPNQNENPDLWSLEQSLPQCPGLILPGLSSSQPQWVAWGSPTGRLGVTGGVKAMLMLPVLQVQEELMLPVAVRLICFQGFCKEWAGSVRASSCRVEIAKKVW